MAGDLLQVDDPFGGLDIHNQADGTQPPAVHQFGSFHPFTCPLDLLKSFNFRQYDPVRVGGKDRLDILLFQAGTDSVDAHDSF